MIDFASNLQRAKLTSSSDLGGVGSGTASRLKC